MKHILLTTYFICLGLTAQNPAFNPEISKGQLYEYADFVDVGQSNIDIFQIQDNELLEFNSLESDNHSVGFTTSNYWLRFRLENSSEQSKVYYLETARPITDVAELFQFGAKEVQKFKSGDQIAFNERQVNIGQPFLILNCQVKVHNSFICILRAMAKQ